MQRLSRGDQGAAQPAAHAAEDRGAQARSRNHEGAAASVHPVAHGQIGKEVYSFPSLIDFLMSPQAKERTKKGGLHLTKVCNKDSPFAAVHHDVPLDRSNYEPSPLLQ